MDYHILNKESIIDYLGTLKKNAIQPELNHMQIDEIGDGNINYVYKVSDNKNKPFVVKQAVPYVKGIGIDSPLSRDRIKYEARYFKHQSKYLSKFIPKVYHADESMSLIIMEYLSGHTVLREGMIAGKKYPEFSNHISTFLAESLFKTSSFYLETEKRKKLFKDFSLNHELCNLTENYVFTFPFTDDSSNYNNKHLHNDIKYLREDRHYKTNILKLKYSFMTKSDALLHGDLHTGSIMTTKDNTVVIDPEFTLFGPFGFDIGKLVGNFLLSYTSHYYHSNNKNYQNWILNTSTEIICIFFEKFIDLLTKNDEYSFFYRNSVSDKQKNDFINQLKINMLQEIVGFSGCVIARRIIGKFGVEDIRSIGDIKARTYIEKISLRLSKVLVNQASDLKSCDDYYNIVHNFFERV